MPLHMRFSLAAILYPVHFFAINSYSSFEIQFRYYVLQKNGPELSHWDSDVCLGPHGYLKITILFTYHTILRAGTMYCSTLHPQGISILPGTNPQKSCDPILYNSMSLYLHTHPHTKTKTPEV